MTDTHEDTPAEQKDGQQDAQQERRTLLTDIGNRLREAREQRQTSLDEVARELKLRTVYLAALENGDWDMLPGDVYGIGFTRQYAHFLGVDLEEDIAHVKSGEYRLTKPLTFPDPPIAPAKRWAVTAILLFIVLFIAFNVFHSADRAPRESSVPNPAAPSTSAPALSKKATAPTPIPAPAKSAPPAPKTVAQTAAQTDQLIPSTSIPSHTYRFEAVGGDVWLQLYQKQGQLLKEALLHSGQHMTIDSNAAYLVMDCGNVGAIRVSVDDKPLLTPGQLGPMGKVIKNYHLAPPA